MNKYSIIKKRKYSYICKNDGQAHVGTCSNFPGFATFVCRILSSNKEEIKKYENEKEW